MERFNYLDNIPAYIQDYEDEGLGLYVFIKNLYKYLQTGYDSIAIINNSLQFDTAKGDILSKIAQRIGQYIQYLNDADYIKYINTKILCRAGNATQYELREAILTAFPKLRTAINEERASLVIVEPNLKSGASISGLVYEITITALKSDFEYTADELIKLLPDIIGVNCTATIINPESTFTWDTQDTDINKNMWDSGRWPTIIIQ